VRKMIKRDCCLTSTILQNMKTHLNGSIPFGDNHLKTLSLSPLYIPKFYSKTGGEMNCDVSIYK